MRCGPRQSASSPCVIHQLGHFRHPQHLALSRSDRGCRYHSRPRRHPSVHFRVAKRVHTRVFRPRSTGWRRRVVLPHYALNSIPGYRGRRSRTDGSQKREIFRQELPISVGPVCRYVHVTFISAARKRLMQFLEPQNVKLWFEACILKPSECADYSPSSSPNPNDWYTALNPTPKLINSFYFDEDEATPHPFDSKPRYNITSNASCMDNKGWREITWSASDDSSTGSFVRSLEVGDRVMVLSRAEVCFPSLPTLTVNNRRSLVSWMDRSGSSRPRPG